MTEAARPDANAPSIRPAEPGEAAAIRGLVTDAYAGYAAQVGRTPGPVRDDYARRIAASEVWVLEHVGEITGVIVLKEEPDRLVIDNVAVEPAAQGNGFGRAMIAFAAEEARRRGFGVLRLYANVTMIKNIALYKRLGFVEVERFSNKGTTRIAMAKRIA